MSPWHNNTSCGCVLDATYPFIQTAGTRSAAWSEYTTTIMQIHRCFDHSECVNRTSKACSTGMLDSILAPDAEESF